MAAGLLEKRISSLETALETTRAMLAVIENSYIEGSALELNKYHGGWLANYSVRVEGHKRWRNISGRGKTAVDAIQDAKSNLFNFAKTRKLMYGASEAIAAIDSD